MRKLEFQRQTDEEASKRVTPEMRLQSYAARQRRMRYYNPLAWLYPNMGVIVWRGAEGFLVRVCFRRWSVNYWRARRKA